MYSTPCEWCTLLLAIQCGICLRVRLLSPLACTNNHVFTRHCCKVWQVYIDNNYNCVFCHCCHMQWAMATPVFAATKYGHYQLSTYTIWRFLVWTLQIQHTLWKLSTQTYVICTYMHVTASSAKGIITVIIIYNILHTVLRMFMVYPII